jgi:hypothetical protein
MNLKTKLGIERRSMNVRFVAAAVLALVSLGACSADPQTASVNDTQCNPNSTVGDISPGVDEGTHCNPTGSNPITALMSALTGGPSTAQASSSATRPPG